MNSFFKLLYRHKLIVVVIFLLLSGGLFLYLFSRESKNTVFVKRGNIIEGVYGIGTVMANRSYHLRSGVLSTITNIHINEGDEVKTGEPLLELDGKTYRAPFPGTVTYFPYKPQENVYPQVAILTLIDFKDRYLVVDLEQEAALRVRPGQTATLSFDSIRKQNFQGKVRSVYSQGQNFLARINITDLPHSILPGMTADVAISITTHKNVLLIPVIALDGNQVHLKKGFFNRSKSKKVKIGVSDGNFAEILGNDLEPGDELEIIIKPGS